MPAGIVAGFRVTVNVESTDTASTPLNPYNFPPACTKFICKSLVIFALPIAVKVPEPVQYQSLAFDTPLIQATKYFVPAIVSYEERPSISCEAILAAMLSVPFLLETE